MNFLPDDYKAPQSNSSYTKLEEGETKIRILTAPIIGWEDWKDKKPYRYRLDNKPSMSLDPDKPIRHFWCFVVWNYKTQKIEIFMVTQASIRKRIEALSKDTDWGSPYHYDLKIVKSGQSINTEYEINPCPARELSQEIKNAYQKLPIDLNEMFTNGDPFAATTEYRTKAYWELAPEPVSKPAVDLVTRDHVNVIEMKIEERISGSDPLWRTNLLNAYKIKTFAALERRLYPTVIKAIEDKIDKIMTSSAPKIFDDSDVPF